MKKILLSLLIGTQALAAAVIFSGSDVKTLKSNIDLNGQAKILSGTTDPTSSATSAPKGSVYLNTSTALVYRKTDSGSSTNWTALVSAAPTQSYEIANVTLTATVASNALTISLKDQAGNNCSSGSACNFGFRNATLTTGTYSQVTVTGSLSTVVSSGSTLGHANAVANYIYVYAINNAGTVELAESSKFFDCGTTLSTTAEGGAGAADSGTTIYSTTARSNVACRIIGRLLSTQTTAGTWASAITEISLWPFTIRYGPTTQTLLSGSGTYTTPTGAKALLVKCVGGGGGGAGSSTVAANNGGAGTTGGITTFGTSLFTANGGVNGTINGHGGVGGTATLGAGPFDWGTTSGGDGSGPGSGGATVFPDGGNGGASCIGGGGDSGPGAAGANAAANTGAGGGGAGANSATSSYGGAGGGAGGCVMGIISNPASSYAYCIGNSGGTCTGGGGGSAGTSGLAGGNGGTGGCWILEFY